MTAREELEHLRSGRSNGAAKRAFSWSFKSPRRARGFIPVLGTGGLGDTVVTLGLCDAIARRTGLPVRLHTTCADAAELLIDRWVTVPHMRGPNVEVCHDPFDGYDFWIRSNSLAFFEFERNFRGFPARALEEMHTAGALFASPPWDNYIRFHPQLDGEAANAAISRGLARWTLPYRMIGLEPPREPYRVDLSVPEYDWEPFVTVHDGYDTTVPNVHRATKTWNLRHWNLLCAGIRRRFPRALVVQIGGKNSRSIPGVDLDLVGRTTITEALRMLSRSLCHVDGDSGFVHAARHLGVPCVALYGPTPRNFFGYPENTNISAGDCGPCFWLTETWLERCPRGLPSPACMDEISHLQVEDAVAAILAPKLDAAPVLGYPGDKRITP